MNNRVVFLFIGLFISEGLCAAEINVAVASNFKYTLQKLATDFEAETGHVLSISSASSGKLFAQIVHGAPYDIFFSADEYRADLLINEKRADAESAYVYALGTLVLLSDIEEDGDCRGVLGSSRLNRLAIANPDIAPYGLASKQVLQKLGLWQLLQSRLVTGENIAQTMQFVVTKNADAGFVALSMINMAISKNDKATEDTCTWHVPRDMYAPIKQKMVLLNKAKNKKSAKVFMQYIRSVQAREIIKASGYDVL